jgi:hypothetical protein
MSLELCLEVQSPRSVQAFWNRDLFVSYETCHCEVTIRWFYIVIIIKEHGDHLPLVLKH